MISKKLLSEIMDDKVKSIRIMNDTIFIYFENNNQEYFINIHELAHKCKEWVHNNYRLQVRTYGGSSCYFVEIYHIDTRIVEFSTHDTEPEAIFKACQWILENKHLKEEK